MDKSLIEQVFERAGGRDKLRQALGLSKQTMSDWLRKGVVPVKHCAEVQALTNIPLAKLNPALDVKAKKLSLRADKAGDK
jgi:DNA-binding transcriptional regulator YdaS (Cro superfamily)